LVSAETAVLSLLLILLLLWFVTAVLLWAGTSWFQGYIYEESTGGLFWRAPAAAAAVTIYLGFWCLLNYFVAKPKPASLPLDVPLFFTQGVEKSEKPVKDLWAKHEQGEAKTHFSVTRDIKTVTGLIILDDRNNPWPKGSKAVEAIFIKEDGPDGTRDVRFNADHDAGRYVEENGRRYMTEEQLGWIYTPPRGGATLAMLAINAFYFAVWFVSLWLLLRFQWSHALGLATVFWLLTTGLIVPQILDRAPRKAETPHSAAALVRLA
jgi:hypothetical protein